MKTKRWIGFFLSLLATFTVLGFWNVQRVSAADVTDKAKFENLKITIASTGDESTGYHGENDTTVALKYSGEFSFPNVTANEIKEGDFFIVEAPSNLSLEDRTLKLEDKISGKTIGNVRVESAKHRLVFTFNSEVEDKQNIRGDFFASAKETVTKEDKIVTYVLPGGKTQIITFKTLKTQQAPVEGEVIYKGGWNHGSLAKAGYYVRINRSQQDLKNKTIEITDDISLGAFASYIDGSFALNEAEFDTTNTNFANLKRKIKPYKVTTDPEEYKKDSDNTALLTLTNGKRSFKLLMPTNMGKKSFFLEYATTSPADTSEIKNSAQFLIDNEPQLTWKKWGDKINTSKESVVTLKTVKAAGASVTADIAGKIKITKFDEADATVKLAGVVFEIREKTTNNLVDTVTTDADGIALSKALSDGKYIVKEKKTKSGYIVNSKEFEVEMKKEGVPLSISNKRKTVDFEATKTWVNGKATDYKEVKLGLYVHKEGQTVADAKPVTGNYTPEVTESNGVYTYKWKNQLPGRDVDGTKLIYSVRELQDQTNLPLKEGEKVKVGENNYVVSYNADKTQVTNTYEVPKTNVTANKVWVGGQEHIRPTFYFKLYRTPEGGAIEEVAGVEEKEVPKTNGTVEWTDLPATDEHGVKYTYSVMEVNEDGNLIVDPIDGYTPAQTADLTVTNTYSTEPAEAVIEAKKKLEGRPTELQDEEFEFILKDNDGKEVQRIKNKGTNADGTGRVVFNPIKFTKEGHYQYTIVEAKAGETENGITYDNRTVPVTVHVYDNGRGQLVAWVENFDISSVAIPAADFASSAPGSNLVPPISGAINTITDAGIQTFTNTYKATKVKVPVAATKSFINKNTDQPIQLKGGEFEFALFEKNGTDPIQTTTNDAAGNIKFEDLEFNKADTYHYTIVEKNAGTTDKGITYSNKTIEVTIKVVDNGKGALEATVTYDNNDSTFENTYKAKNAKASLEVTKKLTGRNLEADMFEFALTDQVGNVETAKNGADGKVKFSELTFDEAGTYTYTIKEVKAGTTENGITYDAKTVTAKVTVTDDKEGNLQASVEYSSDASDGSTTFTNVYTPDKTQVSVKKVWNDGENQDGKRPDSITVNLLADGQDTGKTLELNKENNWSGNFTDLDADKGGTPITYTIAEVSVPAGYTSVLTGDATTGFTITNSYTPAETNVSVTKVWDDGNNQDGLRPTKIIVNLLADGVKVETKEIQAAQDGSWTATFTGLAKYKNGQEIQYTVTEEAVDGYITEITADTATSFTIKNTHDLATVSVEGTKTWDDGNNQDGKRPDKIKVLLNKTVDGVTTKVAEQEVTKDNWTYEFKNLPKYEGGKEITYSIDEEAVEGYNKDIDGYNLKNSYNPATVSVEGTKTWDDGNNQDGKRPDKIKVFLNKTVDGVTTKVAEQEVTAADWSYKFTDLPKFEGGKEITYSIDEEAVEGYKKDIDGYNLKNSYRPGTVSVEGTKTWDDGNNQDGKRPDKIKVFLNKTVDGVTTKVAEQEVTAADWSYKFTNLPKYEGGKEITYSIDEEAVEGYNKDIDGYNLKNSYNPGTVSVQGTKTWDDGDNQDGKRPDKITVFLNKTVDGVTTKVAEQEVTKDNWTYEFKNLPKYEGGKEITYSIDEEPVEGYKKDIDGYNLKNSYKPAKTEVSVRKVWNDSDNQDGKRPASITVKLLADGKDTGKTLELSEATGWAGSFTELDAQKGSKAIDYKVVEATSITGYTTEVTGDAATGFMITNSYSPETVDIKATKNWDDANNQDGKRPTKITINLLADGEKVDSKDVQAATDGTWTAEFKGKAKYKNGKEIKYTVTEETVAEYETTINDFNIINKYLPKAIEYKVTKVWKDANNQDGKRPDSVTVQLYKSVNGSEPTAVAGQTLTLTAAGATDANTWVASFTNLPQFENGQEIVYSVKEVNVPEGYEASVSGQVVTNSHDPETIVISGTKVWDDNENQDGKRTTSVKIQVLHDGQVVDEMEVSAATGWAFESKALPKYKNGKEIAYEVKEVAVASYETEISKTKDGKYTVTNKLTPEKIAVSGQKTWNDGNNRDGKRPDSITVKLLANGKPTDKTATASEATGWKYEFTELDRYQGGKEITYTVEEVAVPEGYKSVPNGMNVTNNYEPKVTRVEGTKTWDDANNQDGIRPSSIQVKLLADGKDTGLIVTASEATGWKYRFEGLAKNQNGKEIKYTVQEVNVPEGYTPEVNGYNITNVHTPEVPPTTPPTTPPSKPEEPQTPGKPKKKNILPSTGTVENFFLFLMGLGTLGGALYLGKKKA